MTPCKIAGCHLASKRLNLSSSLSALRKNTPMATRAPNLAPWRQAAEPLRRPAWMSFVPFLRADRRHPPAGAPFRAPVQGHARTPRPSRGCAALWGARLRRGRRGGVLSAGGIVDTSTCLPLQPSATSLATSRWWSSSLRRLLASRVSFLSPLPRPEGVWCGRVPAGGAEVGEQGPLRWTSLTPLGSSS